MRIQITRKPLNDITPDEEVRRYRLLSPGYKLFRFSLPYPVHPVYPCFMIFAVAFFAPDAEVGGYSLFTPDAEAGRYRISVIARAASAARGDLIALSSRVAPKAPRGDLIIRPARNTGTLKFFSKVSYAPDNLMLKLVASRY